MQQKSLKRRIVLKYIVYNEGAFNEFTKWSDAEYFMLDKPKARCKKVQNKKEETNFKELCLSAPEYIQKIYIVISNNKVHRFDKWKEAKEFIDKNPDSKYKSFTKEEDAQEFANLNVHNRVSSDSLICKIENNSIYLLRNDEILYTSHITISGSSIEKELDGIITGIKKAIEMKEEQILIIYKNLGSEMWANGTWNTNKTYSTIYKKTIEKLRKEINIDFQRG